MKKVLLLFVFVLFINTYLFADSNSEIKKELDEKHLSFVYQYTMDNKIDNFALVIYPHKIMLSELNNKNSVINYDNFDTPKIINNTNEIKLKKFYVEDEIYESIIYKSPSPNNAIFDNILLVKNKNNKIIWDCKFLNGYKNSYIIDIKKYGNRLFIFYYNRCYLYVDFVTEYDLPIIEHNQPIGPTVFDEVRHYEVDEGKIISENIIKIKFQNQIEYWKIKPTKNDSEISEKMKKEKQENDYFVNDCLLLWTNNTLNDRKIILREYKNNDYFEQDTEPTIEQLKEKFPNDTFFTEPEAEQKSINNTTDSTSPGLWQKISLWCRNIISKFTV